MIYYNLKHLYSYFFDLWILPYFLNIDYYLFDLYHIVIRCYLIFIRLYFFFLIFDIKEKKMYTILTYNIV